MTTHTDRAYERDLNNLRERLLAMGKRVQAMIAESVLALTARDSKLASHVMKSDLAVCCSSPKREAPHQPHRRVISPRAASR